MFDRLEDILIRFEEIMAELNDPGVVNDQSRFRKLMKEQNLSLIHIFLSPDI